MKNKTHFWITVVFLLGLVINITAVAQEETNPVDPANIEQNQECLKCHGNSMYFYFNEGLDRETKERMNPYFIIDSSEYYVSNHKSFLCMDCHSYEQFYLSHQ